jgi:hypothetical protein
VRAGCRYLFFPLTALGATRRDATQRTNWFESRSSQSGSVKTACRIGELQGVGCGPRTDP